MKILPTPRQKLVLDYIRKYQKENGISPSYEEIRLVTKTKISTVAHLISKLEERGHIKRNKGITRSIQLI